MQKNKNNKKKPLVSIVLCVYNEEKYLKSCLNSIKKQKFKNYEIVLVDDGSTDKTLEIAKNFPVKIVKQEHKGLGAARNLGVKNSSGKIISFLDADMTFDENYLKNLIKPIIQKKAKGTTHGKEYASNIDNPWARCWGKIRIDTSIPSRKPHNYRAILKEDFLKSGGFESSWGYADDQSLTKKMGNAEIVKDAICYHKNPSSLKETYLQARWIGGSYNNVFLTGILLSFLIAIILFIYSKIYFLILVLLTVALYLIYIFGMTLRTIKREKDFTLIYLYPGFITIRIIATIHGLLRKLVNKDFLQ